MKNNNIVRRRADNVHQEHRLYYIEIDALSHMHCGADKMGNKMVK